MEDTMPVMYSTIDPRALAAMLEADYNLTPQVQCTLWNRGFNDHYLVSAGASRYMLRVYSPSKYWIEGAGDIRFELEFLVFLHTHGIPVAEPLPRRDGDLLGTVQAPEGTRYVALFSYADGEPIHDLNEAQSRIFGVTMARLHRVADSFTSSYPRYHLDLSILVDRPLKLIRERIGITRPDDFSFLAELAEQLKRDVRESGISGDGYGLIHADMHGRNNHFVGGDRLILFDFDHCGYGWRAYDMAVFLGGCSSELRNAFLQGYGSVRELSAAELTALSMFLKIRPIWDTGDMLAMADLWGAGWANSRHWDRLIGQLREQLATPYIPRPANS